MGKMKVRELIILSLLTLKATAVFSGTSMSNPTEFIPADFLPVAAPHPQYHGLPNHGVILVALALIEFGMHTVDAKVVRIEEEEYTVLNTICLNGIYNATTKLLKQSTNLETNQKLRILITRNEVPFQKGIREDADTSTDIVTAENMYWQMAKDLGAQVKIVIQEVDRLFDHRSTRGAFDFVGRGLKWAIGIADDEDVDKFEKTLKADGKALRDIEEFQAKEVGNWKVLHKLDNTQNKYIVSLVDKTDMLLRRASRAEGNEIALINLLSYIVNVGSTTNYIGRTVSHFDGIIEAGIEGRLSPYSISKADLRKTMFHIETKEKILSPLFGSDEIEMYYKLPLTKLHFFGQCIHSGLKVPMIDFRHTMVIKPISKAQLDSAYHSLYVFQYIGYVQKQGFYSLFTNTELANCMKTEREHICTGRKAQITDNVGSTVVHGISQVEYLVKLRKDMDVTIYCPQEEAKVITLNSSCTLTIPMPCNLVAPTFRIPSRREKVEDSPIRCCNISYSSELDLLDKKPYSSNSTKLSLNSPKEFLKDFMINMDDNTNSMEKLEEKLSKDRTIPAGNPSTPEIVLSVILALSLLCLLICGWCYRDNFGCRTKQRPPTPQEAGKNRYKISNSNENAGSH